MKRKLIIGAASLLVALLLFLGYISLTGTKGIPVSGQSKIADIPDKNLVGQVNRVNNTIVHEAVKAVYPTLDPVTRQVRRVFGFEALLNPGRQSNNWQVRRPYMNMYEKRFRCRMDAEEGSIQVEYSGGTPIPKDARLTGKVIIRLLPENEQRFSETVILLDDLNYSNERSEFFTDGPVELISAQARLTGKGLQMIYNPQQERIEYFQIKDVKYLRLKKVVASHFLGKPSATADSSSQAKPSQQDESAVAQAESKTSGSENPGASSPGTAESNLDPAIAEEEPLYQCSIREDVEIRYGKELIIQGADQVNILNFLLNSSSAASSEDGSSASDGAPEVLTEDAAMKKQEEFEWANRDRLPQTPPDDDNTDVVVVCKGGIVIQPTSGVFKTSEPAAVDVQMNGSPMRVLRQDPLQKERSLPLIQCQTLHYNPSADVLKLFAGSLAKKVRVFMNAEGNYVETLGDMLWDMKKRIAQVSGPGRIVFDSAAQKGDFVNDSKSGAEVNFGRHMDVFFAESVDASDQKLALSSVNLSGGMNAVIEKSGFKTEAQSARFEFGDSNRIAQARLSGAVRFISDSASHAVADEALLTFAGDNTLKAADLKGNVAFASTQGQFTSNDAKIQFAENQDGRLQPQSLTTTTASELVGAVSDPSQPPARFEAKKMDYDLLKGSAFALGPIRFSFYAPADANDPTASVPVVITAQRNAEFLTGPDKKNIQKAIFHGDVVGESVEEKTNEKNVRRFYGDSLTVNLDTDAKGRTNINHVAVTDGVVKLQAMRYLDGVLVNHVELKPVRFDYLAAEETITALGPGTIELKNQEIPSSTETVSEKQMFDFRQPCYALVDGFEKLVWYTSRRKMVADGKKDTLNLQYLTTKDNVPDKLTRVAVSSAELVFGKDENNKDILTRLTADGGVYLEQKDAHVLKGQTMHYDGNDGWLHIEGGPNQPCYVDGQLVPVIHYNFMTDEFQFKLGKSPGAVSIPQP